jgi:hypothetical protein
MQVAFLPFTAGAVVVQMEYKAVENMDSIDKNTAIYTIQ